jgi:ABC-type uncharacterized transport system ATPase subunit
MKEINGKYKISIPCPDGHEGCGVCHYAFIPVDAFNQIHDRYYDTYGRMPSERIVAQIYPQIRQDDRIRNLANQWGWDDTEVREAVSEWMEEKVVVFYD